ncbi:MAG TPA: type II toxin-antitoxin system RelE/ParE family toxin [Thermoanaerobaculia bacterium]|nr:type II toxin-antitoxin system RelE/ParE family toxin [Thermoanaerobaculia bacterium]
MGLGADFLEVVDQTLTQIAELPAMYPAVYRGLRRALLRRFPYAVYYRLRGESVRVLAFLHQRRSPNVIRSRTSRS